MSWRRKVGIVAGIFVAIILASLIVVQSPWFADYLRRRVTEELTRATGARVEVGRVHVSAFRGDAAVDNLVLHGTEPAGEAPLFRAARVDFGLSIPSLRQGRVEIRSLRVERPEVNLLIDAEGRTNFPGPAAAERDRAKMAARVIDLGIDHFSIRQGVVHVNLREYALDVQGRDLEMTWDLDRIRQAYKGTVKIGELAARDYTVAAEARLELARDRLTVESLRLASGASEADLSGTVTNWNALEAELRGTAKLDLALLRRQGVSGMVEATGVVRGGEKTPWRAEGEASGRQLAFGPAAKDFNGLAARGRFAYADNRLSLPSFHAERGRATFDGTVDVIDLNRFRASGKVQGIAVEQVLSAFNVRDLPVKGVAAADLTVEGAIESRGQRIDTRIDTFLARATVEPTEAERPIHGEFEIEYRRTAGRLRFGLSHVETARSRIAFEGLLGSSLNVHLRTRDLNDLLPFLKLTTLPGNLSAGLVTFDGRVDGSLDAPEIRGDLAAETIVFEGRTFERLSATFVANVATFESSRWVIEHRGAQLTGSLRLPLENWTLARRKPIFADVTLRDEPIEDHLPALGIVFPLKGRLSGRARATGTIDDPLIEGAIRAVGLSIDTETVDRFDASFRYRNDRFELLGGQAAVKTSRIRVSGTYRHPKSDWRNGTLDVTLSGKAVDLSHFRLAALRQVPRFSMGLAGSADLDVRASLRIVGERFEFTGLNGMVAATNLRSGKVVIGNVEARAASAGGRLGVRGTGTLYGIKLDAESSWQMAGRMPGTATIRIPLASFASLSEAADPSASLPFNGIIGGNVSLEGPLLDPSKMTARLVLGSVRVEPGTGSAASSADLSVRNEGEVRITLGDGVVRVERARFVAKDTTLDLSGTVGLTDKEAWNLRLEGTVNLAVLTTFRPDLESAGTSTMDARLTGTLNDPRLNGRLSFTQASFYLRGVANGLDQVNGTVLFDKNRATVERLTAETGGGTAALSGFVGFGADLVFQLRAEAAGVRVRYPEGVSTQVNANITLTGTRKRSLLAGNVTILRSNINPTSDLGAALVPTMQPPIGGTPDQNEFLSNLQMDIRIDTAQNAQFFTQLTRDVSADVNLRLLGNPVRPTALGRVSITQGEIQFFGTDYSISRGEISFLNPAKIEPQIDLSVQTRIRGITVTINLNGPMNRLNISYRSDPPLQASEILALLAVGRTPGTGSGQGAQTASILNPQAVDASSGGSALLNSAISAPTSGRLQRFFGISRLKIDPQLVGLDNTPQTRLSVEQPLSRDITVTYITNLTRTQEQLVRVEWNLSRTFSAIATRDENGVFAIDFLYRKRFK